MLKLSWPNGAVVRRLAHLLAAGLIAEAACSAIPGEVVPSGTGGGAGAAGSGGATSVQTTTHGAGGSSGGAGGISCDLHCSEDLHRIIDCNGSVFATCPDDQGCGPKVECIPACDAAASTMGSVGCAFYAALPPLVGGGGSCFAAIVTNTWSSPIMLSASFGMQQLDIAKIARIPQGSGQAIQYVPLPDKKLPSGQAAILFLSYLAPGAPHDGYFSPCPFGVVAGIQEDAAVHDSGRGKAFRLTASAPVAAYDVYPYAGAASYWPGATMLLPVHVWDKSYVAMDTYPADPSFGFIGSPFVQIVAASDGTSVTITPTADIKGSADVTPTSKGLPHSYLLDEGQMLQLVQQDDLAGSLITADKPVGLWGGSTDMFVPQGVGTADASHQQALPIQVLSHEYVAARYRDRIFGLNESVPWRLVGVADGTALSYDEPVPAGAPSSLDRGQVIEFSASDPFVIRSQDGGHPFYLTGYMTGCLAFPENFFTTYGDAEQVNIIGADRYRSSYVFFTDPTYGNTNIVFVRKRVGDSFTPVTLDCLGEVQGFQPVGTAGTYELARVDLVKDGMPQGLCDNGVHSATSKAPFGLTVWGWDDAASYAYTAGMGDTSPNGVAPPPQ